MKKLLLGGFESGETTWATVAGASGVGLIDISFQRPAARGSRSLHIVTDGAGGAFYAQRTFATPQDLSGFDGVVFELKATSAATLSGLTTNVAGSAPTELLIDPGFELGDAAWTLTPSSSYAIRTQGAPDFDDFAPHDGSWFMHLIGASSPTDDFNGTAAQNLTLVTGKEYNLRLWLNHWGTAAGTNPLLVTIMPGTLGGIVQNTYTSLGPASGWRRVEFGAFVATGTSGYVTLQVNAPGFPNPARICSIDDVSVQATTQAGGGPIFVLVDEQGRLRSYHQRLLYSSLRLNRYERIYFPFTLFTDESGFMVDRVSAMRIGLFDDGANAWMADFDEIYAVRWHRDKL